MAASLREFPMAWRRNTQIQMYWLRKWLESYNNCTFSTWKNKWLFNLLCWISNSFCTFHYYGRGGTPSLASPDGTSLIFIIQSFEQLALALKNRVALKFFTVLKYFLPFTGFLSNFALALKNRVCPEIFHCIEYAFHIQDFWTTCACPEKQRVPWNHCIEYILFII